VRFLLVHSPLVGPATWRWVAEALRSSGHEVTVPDLTEAAATGAPDALISAAIPAQAAETLVIVGHSGAGFFLPSIAAGLEAPARGLVFVDASIPPGEGEATAGADVLDRLRSLATDGVLPMWSTWWGEGVMETLVPDDARRAEIEVEMPEIPLALYESPIILPTGWRNTPGAFILLSEPYHQEAQTATSLGWPVIERLGAHLDIVNDPESIARNIVQLVR
jgi:pimeloyl-ACP methyl ester carboxylesterase